ncbi:MAG: cupin domain-containing protein [Methanobacteriota archaeon]
MPSIYPEIVKALPEADIPFDGARVFISQAETHQIVFMEFDKDTDVPEHSHASQWEIVLEGRAEVTVEGRKNSYGKGDRFFIDKEVKHSARIHAGYASFAIFDQRDRYKPKRA